MANGRDLDGAKEDGTMGHVVEGNDSVVCVNDLVIFIVAKSDLLRVPCIQESSLSYWKNRWCKGTTSDVSYGGQELEQTKSIGHCMIYSKGKDETPTLESHHLDEQVKRRNSFKILF